MESMKKSLCIIFLFIGISLSAQDISLKTNLLYDISTTFNLGAEFRLAPKWTLDVSANYNPFTFSDSKKWKHWMAQPEARRLTDTSLVCTCLEGNLTWAT